MKIRKFSTEETAELISLISERDSLVLELNELSITFMLLEYEKYKSQFKYSFSSPLTFKPMTKDKFISAFMGGGGVYTKDTGRFVDSVGKEKVQYLYGWRTKRTWEYDSDVLNSALWLTDIASTRVIRDVNEDDPFIHILLNYAQQPFEFTDADIERIVRWKRDVVVFSNTVKALKDELQAK